MFNKKNYIIIILFLIFLSFIIKNLLLLNIFYGGKIYYKNKKKLNRNRIQNKIKNYQDLKISFNEFNYFIKSEKPKISLIQKLYYNKIL